MASTSGSKRRQPSSGSSDSDQECSSRSKSNSPARPLKRGCKIEAKLDMTEGEDTKRLLECPICFEILVSPIYQCPGGHIICKTCKPKLANCPSCEKPIGIIRNLALESVLEKTSFPCNHHHKGCKVFFKIQDLQEHIDECDYRPLKCHLHGQNDCDETSLYLVDTVRHLEDTHELETVEPKRGHLNVFTSKNNVYWIVDDDSDDGSSHHIYPSELFNFDHNVFVALIRKAEFLTHFGFYLIGSKEDASKYSVTITVEEKNLEDVVFKLKATTRIASIRDFQAELSYPKVPQEVAIGRAAFVRDEEIAEDAIWEVTYKINKIKMMPMPVLLPYMGPCTNDVNTKIQISDSPPPRLASQHFGQHFLHTPPPPHPNC